MNKRLFKPFKNTQKVRVIINGLHLTSTIKNIFDIITSTLHYDAVYYNFLQLESEWIKGNKIIGFGARHIGVDVQIDLIEE